MYKNLARVLRSKGTKNEKVWNFVRESSSGVRSSCGVFSGAVHYAGGKICACCVIYIVFIVVHRMPSPMHCIVILDGATVYALVFGKSELMIDGGRVCDNDFYHLQAS